MQGHEILSIKCEKNIDEGIADGIISCTGVIAEAEVEDGENKRYFICTWNLSRNKLDFEAFPKSMINNFIRGSGDDADYIQFERENDGYFHIDNPHDSEFEDIVMVLERTIKKKIMDDHLLDEDDIEELFDENS